MRLVVYARYSSDLQSAASAEDQIAICKKRIAREGWSLAGVFVDEGISGASMLNLVAGTGNHRDWTTGCY